MRQVTRLDKGELRAPERTAEGYLYVYARIARPGIYLYSDGRGGFVRELVPPEVLNDSASLETLFSKPVTLEHPPVDVTASNWKTYAVGEHGRSYEVDDEDRPVFRLFVKDEATIKSVDEGSTTEYSPGYLVEVDFTPGYHPVYGRYDQKQVRRIRYNHGAICGRARGGEDIKLRVDAYAVSRCDDSPQTPKPKGDGMTLEEALKAGIVVTTQSYDAEKQRADKAEAEVETLRAANDSLTTERDTLKGRVDGMPTDEATAKARLDWYNERAPLVDAAATFEVENADSLDNADLRKAVVLKAVDTADKDGSADYYAALFDASVKPALDSKGKANPYSRFGFNSDSGEGANKPKPAAGTISTHTDSVEDHRKDGTVPNLSALEAKAHNERVSV